MEVLADKVHKQGEHIPQQASHVKVFMACNVMVIVSFRNSLLWVSMFILSNLIMGSLHSNFITRRQMIVSKST